MWVRVGGRSGGWEGAVGGGTAQRYIAVDTNESDVCLPTAAPTAGRERFAREFDRCVFTSAAPG